MFDSVLIATDGSANGGRAVRVALDMADRFDADVVVLSVVDPADEESESRAKAAVADVAERSDRAIETVVREGDPPAVIRAIAADREIDLVATGTRGRDGEYRFLLGSVAEAVVRTCPVPVLTVRRLGSEEATTV